MLIFNQTFVMFKRNEKCYTWTVHKLGYINKIPICSQLVLLKTFLKNYLFILFVRQGENVIWVFPKCFHWIQRIQWQKIFVIKSVHTYHLDATTAPTRNTCDIFKLSLIHASVIFQIPWIRWIHRTPVPFRENSNELNLGHYS